MSYLKVNIFIVFFYIKFFKFNIMLSVKIVEKFIKMSKFDGFFIIFRNFSINLIICCNYFIWLI